MADPIKDGLSAYWRENAAREAANPPSDRPTYAEMQEHAQAVDDKSHLLIDSVWVIEPGSTGVFLGRWRGTLFLIEDAGDLWPSRPSHWLSRDRAAEIAATRAALAPATEGRKG